MASSSGPSPADRLSRSCRTRGRSCSLAPCSDATSARSGARFDPKAVKICASVRIISRRAFLNGIAAASAMGCRAAAAQPAVTRLILLGTAGGPRPQKARAAPAQVILRNNVAYVIDCGDGVARQLALAGVPLRALRHVFITHHHSDHNADYGNLILLAWTAG